MHAIARHLRRIFAANADDFAIDDRTAIDTTLKLFLDDDPRRKPLSLDESSTEFGDVSDARGGVATS